MMMLSSVGVAAGLLLLLVVVSPAAAVPVPVFTGHYVKMRDGVKLYTEVWRLEGWSLTEPRGVVLDRSPYPRAVQAPALPWLAEGYVVVLQSMRGMQESGGNFSFWRHGAADGADTLAWIANQTFSNGNVFGFGISADGINAYTSVLDAPPQLRGQLVIWASGEGHPVAYQTGTFREELTEAWLTTILRREDIKVVFDHELDSPWWMTLDGHYSQVKNPTVHWGGWYDIFQQLQIDTWNGFQTRAGSPDARGHCYLVMTPHGHCAFSVGLEPFPDSETELPAELAKEIFAERNTLLPAGSSSRRVRDQIDYVNLYLMAPRDANPSKVGNYWVSLPAFPAAKSTSLYFDIAADGLIAGGAPPPTPSSTYYHYHPDFPVPTWGGNNLFSFCGPRFQNDLAYLPDVITLRGAPLSEPLAICGEVDVNLFVSSDQQDTDFTAKLLDVYPDGREALLVDSALRMKFRNSVTKPEPMTPGVVYNVTFGLWSTCWVFPEGHRVGLQLSSSNAPRFQPHINRFAPIAEWSKLESRVARNSLFSGPKHPAKLILPVVPLSQLPRNPNITAAAFPPSEHTQKLFGATSPPPQQLAMQQHKQL